jgi:hypothetical protein
LTAETTEESSQSSESSQSLRFRHWHRLAGTVGTLEAVLFGKTAHLHPKRPQESVSLDLVGYLFFLDIENPNDDTFKVSWLEDSLVPLGFLSSGTF